MAALSGTAVQAIIAAFDFGRFNRIVDVGGADGFLLAAILSAYPGPVESCSIPPRSGGLRP
jgi:hypothetical protein